MRGLKLFIADIVDDDTSEQTFWYVVGKTYESALKRFTTEANGCYPIYSYYFNEASEEYVEKFIDRYGIENFKAGIYDAEMDFR